MPSIALSWAANPENDNVTAYEVWGADGTSVVFSSCIKIATVSALTWTETALPVDQPRTYYIVAVNAVGASSPDGPLNITSGSLSGDYVANVGGAPSLEEGTHGARPAAGNEGAIYVETDTKTIWRDSGASWDQIGSGGGGGGGAYRPMVDGSAPPNLIYEPDGSLVMEPFTP